MFTYEVGFIVIFRRRALSDLPKVIKTESNRTGAGNLELSDFEAHSFLPITS